MAATLTPDYKAPPPGSNPTSLVVVASSFIAFGILSVLMMFAALFWNGCYVDLNFLCIFAGLGLLKHRRGWRTFALFILWLALIFLPIFLLWISIAPDQVSLRFMGQKVMAPQWLTVSAGITFCFAGFCFALWQYRVLTRPDMRALFGLVTQSGETVEPHI